MSSSRLNQRIRVKEMEEFGRVAAVRARCGCIPRISAPSEQPGDDVPGLSMARDLERVECSEVRSPRCGRCGPAICEPFRGAASSLPRVPRNPTRDSARIRSRDGYRSRRFAEALASTRVVPIHTATPEAFQAKVANVDIRSDGEWWPV